MTDALNLLAWGPTGWGDELTLGALLTIALALATLPVGLSIGFAVALAKRSESRALRNSAETFATIFRGLPELLTLFIIYFGGQLLLQAVARLFTDEPIQANAFVAGMIALGLVFASYASEVFAAAFNGIPRGQWEGASALGLHRFATMRLVIIPQLIRLALPGLSNLWLGLIKDTSLVSVIALNDLLRMTSNAVGNTKQPFFFYLVACFLYLVMAVVSSFGIRAIERWSEKGERQRVAANPAAGRALA